MKLTILVPSQEYKSYAGARIRYLRIASHLAKFGLELTLEDIRHFNPETSDCEAVLISKCHDARSLLVAAAVSGRGKLVGVDLFDDYFSDTADSRLLRFRNWFSQLVEICDFALCSTEAMVKVVERYRSDLPSHVMNDPAPEFSLDTLSSLVEKKLAYARKIQRIHVAWFGVGDNPYFPVGLSDLSAFSAQLRELTVSGMDVELTILTNSRALTADGLSLVNRIPVATQLSEWSEGAERDLLQEALLAFLPVNAQRFSVAKSLNRAVTALSFGCQVLSVGYPLYAALEPLIYRDPDTFLADLAQGSMRLSGQSFSKCRETIDALATPEVEASRLALFLCALRPKYAENCLPVSLIHGHSTLAEVHSLVQAVNGFSVASPYCSAALDFDVVFLGAPFGVRMLVSPKASHRLLPQVQARLQGRERIRGRQFLRLRGEADGSPGRILYPAEWDKEPIPFQLATYASAMRQIERRMTEAFGPCRTILSESAQLPFPSVAWAA